MSFTLPHNKKSSGVVSGDPKLEVLVLHDISIVRETLYQEIRVQDVSSEVEHRPAEIEHLVLSVSIVEQCTTHEDPGAHHHRANCARDYVKKADVIQWDGIVVVSGDGLLFEVSFQC
ncbi:hypothetical protein AVEN_86417-1 [Araneus ventricosus]|uniref:Uncharacterized protein n=1 Tax=Araneus ventricosus TaxID=182803 RepID=A0A4Y2KT54_ARAVE|nr:hypothetical protein AVEN_86417-1 [Araneus ventricosus]